MTIVYRELSSLEQDLGVKAKTLYAVSNRLGTHYHTVSLPKADGSHRQLSVPDELLKSIQRKILRVLLSRAEISPYATAYRYGGGIVKNARVHAGKVRVLKLDIRHFFDSVRYSTVKDKVFPPEQYSEQNRILLAMLCYYRDALPQGAPTSPAISNIILREFDNRVGGWCAARGIVYTRYCDDMAFSGPLDAAEVMTLVRKELAAYGFRLNERKTKCTDCHHRQTVTGLVVNDRVNVPSSYRKRLRQEIYYCQKFGVSSHLRQIGSDDDPQRYLHRLLGQVGFVLSASPDREEMLGYRQWLREELAAAQYENTPK